MDKISSVEGLAFAFGCVFLAVGLIGGGMTISGNKVPKLAIIPRVLIGLAGCLLIAAGLGASSIILKRPVVASKNCENLPPNTVPANVPVVEITDRLGDQQDFERVDLSINGILAGALCVEEGAERASIKIPLTGKKETWSATGVEQRRLRDRTIRTRSISGSGEIDLSAASVYSVRIVADGSTETVQTIWLRRN